jgi:hypothetical protein
MKIKFNFPAMGLLFILTDILNGLCVIIFFVLEWRKRYQLHASNQNMNQNKEFIHKVSWLRMNQPYHPFEVDYSVF